MMRNTVDGIGHGAVGKLVLWLLHSDTKCAITGVLPFSVSHLLAAVEVKRCFIKRAPRDALVAVNLNAERQPVKNGFSSIGTLTGKRTYVRAAAERWPRDILFSEFAVILGAAL